jgi:hypothetical protein
MLPQGWSMDRAIAEGLGEIFLNKSPLNPLYALRVLFQRGRTFSFNPLAKGEEISLILLFKREEIFRIPSSNREEILLIPFFKGKSYFQRYPNLTLSPTYFHGSLAATFFIFFPAAARARVVAARFFQGN